MLFTGNNNGEIALGLRHAMRLPGCSFNFTWKMFGELEDKGFVKPKQRGSFGWKTRHVRERIVPTPKERQTARTGAVRGVAGRACLLRCASLGHSSAC